jgi:AbrB family looped-hinge helix DNA binding protein
MAAVTSKVTTQGRTTVPAAVRRKLGIGSDAILEWNEEGGKIFVRRTAQFSSEDIHRALFPRKRPEAHTIAEMKEGVRRRVKERNALR